MEELLSPDDQLAAAAQELLTRRQARTNLLPFIKYTYADFEAARHHLLMIQKLEDVAAGRLKRLMIFLPPRHGKSLIVSRRFPAWYLGQHPDHQVLMMSYQERLARVFGRDVRNLIQGQRFKNIFPDLSVAADARAAAMWNTNHGDGGFLAAGLGSGKGTGVTGFGAHLLLIDDPIKGRKDADSETIRKDIQNSLQSDVFTRMYRRPWPAAIVYVGTRWHIDDPAGWILENDNENEWTVICLPALAEKDDLMGRQLGEALWPERFPRQYLLSLRDNPSKVGVMAFESLYQQHPTVQSGNLFKTEDYRFWDEHSLPSQFDAECISVDTGISSKDGSDPSCIQHWGRFGARFYLVDQLKGTWNFAQLVDALRIFCDARPWVAAKLVEKKANGQAVLDTLALQVPGLIPVEPLGSKEQRANAVLPYVVAHGVFLPDKKLAPWVEDFLLEATQFPHGKHDDQVDCQSQALYWLAKQGQTMTDVSSSMIFAFGSR